MLLPLQQLMLYMDQEIHTGIQGSKVEYGDFVNERYQALLNKE